MIAFAGCKSNVYHTYQEVRGLFGWLCRSGFCNPCNCNLWLLSCILKLWSLLKSTILDIFWQTHSKRRCTLLIRRASVESNHSIIGQVLCFISLVLYSDRLNKTSLFLLITVRTLGFFSSHLSLLLRNHILFHVISCSLWPFLPALGSLKPVLGVKAYFSKLFRLLIMQIDTCQAFQRHLKCWGDLQLILIILQYPIR